MKQEIYEIEKEQWNKFKLKTPKDYIDFLFIISNQRNTYLKNVIWSDERDLSFEIILYKVNKQINIYFEFDYNYGTIHISDYSNTNESEEMIEYIKIYLNIK